MKKIFIGCVVLLLMISFTVDAQELTFDQLIAHVEEKLLDVEDFRIKAVIEVVEGERINRSAVVIETSQAHRVVRVEIVEPDILAGQIIVIDEASNAMKMYMPAFDQIIVQKLDNAEADLGLGVDFTDISKMFNIDDVDGEIKEIMETDTGLNYVIVIDAITDQFQFPGANGELHEALYYLWINADFMPFKIEVIDNDNYLGAFYLEQYELNIGLTADELLALPDVPLVEY